MNCVSEMSSSSEDSSAPPANPVASAMIVKSGNIQGCYRPRRTNDGPVYSGYENPNRPIVNPHRIIMKQKRPVR